MSEKSKSAGSSPASVNETTQESPEGSPSISRRRRRLFIVVTILLPIVMLAGVEVALRLCGVGGHAPIVNVIGEFKNAQLATLSIEGAASYFDRTQSTPGSIGVYTFSIPKPTKTFRVLLAGASAVKGYPQPMGLANSAFLSEMLSDVWPDRNVEILNLGTTAVATFPVLDMLTQMLEFEPDLVVIYAGHNEFFGAYGVGSAQTGGSTPASIRLTRWRNGLGLVKAFAKLFAGHQESKGKALMEAMVGQSSIAPDSPLREAAARNAGYHIGQMIQRCRNANVPVMVCTLSSNEKNLVPVGAVDLSKLDESDLSRLGQLVKTGISNISSDTSLAIQDLEASLKIAPDHSRVQFLLGNAYLAAGDNKTAATYFQRAIDCDTMPWRAPSQTNEQIVLAAKSHGIPICDVRQAFRDASPDGIIGRYLMDDHVHFSLRGQELLARTIVKSLTEFSGPCAVDKEMFQSLREWQEYAKRLGANEYERYAVAHGLRNIFGVPFMQASNPEAYAHWDGVCKQLLQHWPISFQRVAQEWQDPKSHRSVRRPLSAFVARAMIREKDFARAKPLMETATRNVPKYSTWNIEYVYSTLLCNHEMKGRLDDDSLVLARETIERIRFMLRHVEKNPGLLLRYCGRIHQLCDEWKESIPILEKARKHLWDIEKVACDAALVEAYIRTEDNTKARALANEGIKNAGQFTPHYQRFLNAIPPG